jgi:hypothetical protein
VPILAGPWTSELGFESLYWLPFLDHVRTSLGIPPERLIPISRGGAAEWYGVPLGVELYAMRTIQQCRVAAKLSHQHTGLQKQYHVTDFDRGVIRDAAESLKLKNYQVLHPSWMYHLLTEFWDGQRGLQWASQYLRFRVLPPPALPDGLHLPEKFAAVRFYARSTWPASRETAVFAQGVIAQLAQQMPVILLNPGLHADEHIDFAPQPKLPNVHLLTDLCPVPPERDLAIQAAVLARSVGFVGTYGGVANLALRFGRPVFSFYMDWQGTMLAHRHLLEAHALSLGLPFQIMRVGELPIQQSIIPKLITQ